VAEKILQWRSFAKLNSTYVEGLIEAQNDKTRRIHTSYNLAATSTGRLSSSDPNLQNIPIRTEEGRKIRKAFIPGEGFTLVSFDYSQIELRLLAHMADVPPLVEAFKGGEDIHKSTASLIFGVPLNEVSGELRRKAKAVNFGIIYGISAFGLAQQLGCGNSEAAEIIKSYFQKYGGIQDYMEHQKTLARSQGFVTTIMDRPCYTPFINDKNPMRRQFAERQAINAPLQGSSADLIKKAMIAVHKKYGASLDVRMLLQVHDELVFEIKPENLASAGEDIKGLMEKVATLKVPLVVDYNYGDNWDEAH
jgi:DNA polymerase-1